MKLSIITINYNNAVGLQKTLKSLLTQTLSPRREEDLEVEHIIIDGGSTDGSVDIIRHYAESAGDKAIGRWGDEDSAIGQRPNIHQSAITVRWISEHDSGIYNAMNKGIEIAIGHREVDSFNRSTIGDKTTGGSAEPDHYIQILNSGDILASEDVISRMASALQNSASTSSSTSFPQILYGNMLKAMPNGKIVRDNCGGSGACDSFLYFYKGTLNHDCAWIKRSLFDKFGLYDEEMKICSDWKWYVRTIVLGDWAMRREGEKAEGERLKPVVPIYTNIDVTIFDMTGVSEDGGKNRDLIRRERREYLESILPPAVLRDYDMYAFPVTQYQRLRKYHLWGLVYFVERVLFKLEKWGILK